jgi:predicted anti-sigma-YlaC factor YlaD
MTRAGTEITCRELVELVTDYFEGRLPEVVRVRFEDHLQLCPGCDTYLEQMRTTVSLINRVDELERRPEVGALLTAFRDFHAGGSHPAEPDS